MIIEYELFSTSSLFDLFIQLFICMNYNMDSINKMCIDNELNGH